MAEAPAEGHVGAWSAAGLSQNELMYKDECVLVDEADNITGHASKWQAHRFEGAQPSGLLHRAFSVFLFDGANRLLLQQRALSKITFPGVWTNTCCSHQLHGYQPTEVDGAEDVAAGKVMGTASAAVRKLDHELGLPSAELPLQSFRYLTRLHYCAADRDPSRPDSPWGEHEMDYILFIRVPDASLAPNPEEVADVRYVTQDQLKEMMDPASGLKWSPWFRIIAQKFLPQWWADLDAVLLDGKHADWGTIHKVVT